MLRLLTVPISHYCEKARWALDWLGLPYTEEAHLQVFHYWPVWRTGGGRTVPVLVHPGGVLTDSTDILHWADAQAPPARRLFPGAGAERAEVERLEAYFDEELGPAGRLWMYHHVLDGAAGPALKYNCTGVPSWQRRLFPMAFPVVAGVIKRVLHVAPATAEAALSRAQRVLDEVAVRLADGRPYLVGGHFSAADLTFAALCAPLLAPPGYGVPLPRPEELPPACARVIEASRAHPAGRFALGLYETHRRT